MHIPCMHTHHCMHTPQASELNVQPMPLLPRSSSVQLPPSSQWLPSARRRAEEEDADDVAWYE